MALQDDAPFTQGEPLASGGMAELHIGYDANGHEFAIKRLLSRFTGLPEYRRMFASEGRLALLLRHPNLVHTYAFGTDANGPYLKMERLHGEDLRTLLRQRKAKPSRADFALPPGRLQTKSSAPSDLPPKDNVHYTPIPIDAALAIGIAVADGLHAAHELCVDGEPIDLIHRDISPHNIFVLESGEVKLLDFGIARTSHREWKTEEGTLKGKVPYMAPEQLRGNQLDRRSDVYSLGVVLFELLLGCLPYAVSSVADVPLMLAIASHEVVAPSAINEHFPAALESALQKAIAFRPSQRFQTAAELSAALRAAGTMIGMPPSPAAVRALLGKPSQAQTPGNDEMTAPAARCGAIAAVEQIEGVTIFTLVGAIDEGFSGTALGVALKGPTIFDVSQIRRITSYGVREWLDLVNAVGDVPCALFGCPEAIVSQMETVRGFRGPIAVASVDVPFHCPHCGFDFTFLAVAPSPTERHAPSVPAETRPCPSCARDARAEDEGASYLTWLRIADPVLYRPIPELTRRREEDERALFSKTVSGAATTLLLRRPPTKGLRWSRILDGIEGALTLDVTAWTTMEAADAECLAMALSRLTDVTVLEIPRVPVPLFQAISARRPPYKVLTREIAKMMPCPSCNSLRMAVGSVDAAYFTRPQPSKGASLPVALHCVHCTLILSTEKSPSLPMESEPPPPPPTASGARSGSVGERELGATPRAAKGDASADPSPAIPTSHQMPSERVATNDVLGDSPSTSRSPASRVDPPLLIAAFLAAVLLVTLKIWLRSP